MSAQSGNSRNKVDIKSLCIYALLVAISLVFGYIESLVPFILVAPGIKLGLSNAVTLLIAAKGDIKGAFAVNIVRVLLSALLFGSAISLIFSLSGGIASLIAVALVIRLKSVSVIGASILGGTVHNVFQLLSAFFIVGEGVLLYLPVLLIGGALSGAVIGVLSSLLIKKLRR